MKYAIERGDWVVLWSEVNIHEATDITDGDIITKCGLRGRVEKDCKPPMQEPYLEYCTECCIEEIKPC